MTGTATRIGDQTIPTEEWASVEQRNIAYRAVLCAYVAAVNAADVDALIALFAADAIVTDPHGGTRHIIRGHEAIRDFYAFVVRKMRLDMLLVTGSGGNAAAMAVRARVGDDVVDNISIAHFDQDGLICRYTTYWGPGDRRKNRSPTAKLP